MSAATATQCRYDDDLFRFDAKAGDQWIIETKAARDEFAARYEDRSARRRRPAGAAAAACGRCATRVIEFRGMNSEQRGVRLANWEEMLLNEYVYLSGEVIKHFQQRRGPDADAQFYPENGNRFAFFDTTSRAHALGEPAYIVVPYAVGTELPNNGLPVFTRQLRERRRRAAEARQGFAADVRRPGGRHVPGPRHRRSRLRRRQLHLRADDPPAAARFQGDAHAARIRRSTPAAASRSR